MARVDRLTRSLTSTRHKRPAVLFLAPGDVGKGRVEPISWMRTCEAYAAAGHETTLATLRVSRPDAIAHDSVWEHFAVPPTFRILRLRTILRHDAPVWKFRIWAGLASVQLAVREAAIGFVRRGSPTIVHGRSPVMLAPFVVLSRLTPKNRRPSLVFETHALPTRRNAWLLRRVDLIVVNSAALASMIARTFGVPERRILHAGLPPFNETVPGDQIAARGKLGLDCRAMIACYTGKMTEAHNEFLLQTAARVTKRVTSFRLLLVGGNPLMLDWTRARVSELDLGEVVIVAGFVRPSAVCDYQAASDVLLYHMPETVAIFPFTTPAKGYEYQAAERPIVATDFPLFEEVFGHPGDRAVRVVDRTPDGFAAAIEMTLQPSAERDAMVARAAAFVRGRTWRERVRLTLQALGR